MAMAMATTGVMAMAPSTPACASPQKHRHFGTISAASSVSVHARHVQQRCRCAATSEDGEASTSGGGSVGEAEGSTVPEAGAGGGESVGTGVRRRRADAPRAADSTDWISSNLTRRFGLGAGLAWVGVLAFGVISEQVKTRNEVFREEQGTRDVEGSKEVTLPNGIRYTELREGGGSSPQRGDLVVINLTGRVGSTGEAFIDTTAKGKRPVAFIFGARPLSGGMCDGVEYVLRSTKVGGKRRITVPAAFAFGEAGTTLSSGAKIPGNATLEYVVELQKASIAPS
ncbi:hypothetical protein M758_7G100700 [Ceratodon purpureus]|nr:hypothetical protein M758_7G100700 [Ceratodon purpureus]